MATTTMRRDQLPARWWPLALLPLVFILAAPRTARGHEPRAAIDVSSEPAWQRDVADDTIVARVREALTERLTQEGFHVVAPDAEPEVIVSVSVGASDCVLRATLPTEIVARRIAGCGFARPDDQLELVQKATELVRSAYRRAAMAPPVRAAVSPAQAPGPPPLPQRSPVSPLLRAVAAPPTVPAPWQLSAGVDLRIRTDRVDPVVRAGGRVRLDAKWALHFTTALARMTTGLAASQPLDVTEGTMLAGLGRRIHDSEHLRIEGTILAGALVHHFDDHTETGTRFDALVAVALTGTVPLSRHLAVEVRLAPGMSRTEYRHLAGNVVTWQGGRLRLDAGIGVAFF